MFVVYIRLPVGKIEQNVGHKDINLNPWLPVREP